jgi:hypothetical protein
MHSVNFYFLVMDRLKRPVSKKKKITLMEPPPPLPQTKKKICNMFGF